MLTGAGILSACVGLGLLSQPVSSNDASIMNWILIALTLSVAFSDGICMAIGHVWSTQIVAGAAHEERKKESRNFEVYRSDAKERLVDALLLQGMLKIDAMSLADTLEGYPDLFVSALLGGGICADGNNSGNVGGLGGSSGFGMVRVPGESLSSRRQYIPSLSYGPEVMAQNRPKYESYCDLSAFRYDHDHQDLSETVSGSRLEGLFMMLSFSSFSVIPSLIHTLLPPVLNLVMAKCDAPFDALVTLLSLCISAFIMFLLGVWKSCFYSSSWFLFGLKNMGVFGLCVVTAYSFGFVCGILVNSKFS
mmetsp:Transcript_21922/g.47613  ORF Transcript_21922/g.47613 Transcript_21922/m.47613 type:complete len:306 (+) Transcript_21922:1-918(+)